MDCGPGIQTWGAKDQTFTVAVCQVGENAHLGVHIKNKIILTMKIYALAGPA
jgi:hypothetical protein